MTDGRPSPWFRPQEEKGVGAPRRTGTVTGRGGARKRTAIRFLKGQAPPTPPLPARPRARAGPKFGNKTQRRSRAFQRRELYRWQIRLQHLVCGATL